MLYLIVTYIHQQILQKVTAASQEVLVHITSCEPATLFYTFEVIVGQSLSPSFTELN